MSANQSLIFIPDISGYTQFVNNTEISHQAHILTELLNMLIDSNDLSLELAEVEGDALFYYKTDSIPNYKALEAQVKKMFVRFHSHLRYYDKYRLCHCGACAETTGLSLKFIVHVGELGFLELKGQKKKPHGKEVIVAHRVLKNDVPGNDYLLFTESALNLYQSQIDQESDALQFLQCHTDYGDKDIGSISYCYSDLSPFRKLINEPTELIMEKQVSKPVRQEQLIHASPVDLFEIILNFEHRMKWNKGADDIVYDENEMNKVGTSHQCIIGGKTLNFKTVTSDFGENKWVYGEKLNVPFLKEFIIYFIIEPSEKESLLKVEVHPIPKPVIGHLMLPLLKKQFKKSIEQSILDIKSLAENQN